MKKPPKSLDIKLALDLMRLPNHRLIVMHSNSLPDGRAFYVIPGGGTLSHLMRKRSLRGRMSSPEMTDFSQAFHSHG